MRQVTIAIDPGKSGALVVRLTPSTVFSYKCPETQKDMVELVKEYKELTKIEDLKVKAYIEKVHAMPGEGVKSVWSFSANYATWQASLIAFNIPFEEVTPQTWMKKLGALPKERKARKNLIKDKMQKLFPDIKVTLYNADALAILTVMS